MDTRQRAFLALLIVIIISIAAYGFNPKDIGETIALTIITVIGLAGFVIPSDKESK